MNGAVNGDSQLKLSYPSRESNQKSMWRSFFLALGAYCCLLGLETLCVDRAVLKPRLQGNQIVAAARDVDPPDWAPWSLLAAGTVVVLYSLTLTRKSGD